MQLVHVQRVGRDELQGATSGFRRRCPDLSRGRTKPSPGRTHRVLLVAAAALALSAPSALLAAVPPPDTDQHVILPALPRLRTLDSALAEALQRGREQSATFRQILDTLERSNVVVYLDRNNRFRDGEAGHLRFAGHAKGLRYVHVSLSTDLNPRELIVLLAHELAHAVEIAMAEEVVDADSFRDLYCQIGHTGRFGVDTDAAQRVTEQVSDELELLPFR
jgi:hypothetical protein